WGFFSQLTLEVSSFHIFLTTLLPLSVDTSAFLDTWSRRSSVPSPPSSIMFGLSVVGVAFASPHQSSSAGTSIQLPPDNLHGHTISLFQQVPRAQFEPRSEDDMHTYIKAEVDRVMAKYDHTFDRFRAATGVDHFLDTRSEKALSEKRQSGEMPLTPIRDGAMWIGWISVGTGRGQARLSAKFDTGAVDTILHRGHYDRRNSRTAQDTRETFQIDYVDGSRVQGRVVLDSVFVAGLEAHDVAVGDAITSLVSPNGFEVIVGMASLTSSSQTSAFRRPGLIPTLLAQHAIQHNLFGFGLWKDGGARLDIGHTPTEYRGRIAWIPILNPEFGMWTAPFAISGVEGLQIGVVDTGSRMIVGPYELVRSVIIAAGMEVQEQDGQVHSMYQEDGPRPYVSINIAGLNVVFSAGSLAYETREHLTFAGIVGQRDMDGWWLLGDTFLQNVYAIFDGDRQMLGFAPH
ncbi:hypothetical protein V8E36_008819, partial [Tilletia maclaganii]